MKSAFNALQIWSPDGEELVSQILYIPQGSTYVCQLAIQPQHREHVIQLFPKYFQDRMLQTLRFLQAYISASRHNTTTVRFHYSQTQDVSNVTPVQAVSFFPYDICPLDLDPTLLQTLKAPSNLLTTYTGLQPLIQQAMEDHSIDPENYGKGAKGKVREGSQDLTSKGWKSKGKGRGQEGKSQNYRFSNEGKGKQDSNPQSTGKGYNTSKTPWWQPKETLTPWAKSQAKDSSSSSKGDRNRPAPNRRLDNSDPSLTPCSNCVALLGTNSDCMDCLNSDNLQWVRSNSLFQDLQPFQQRVIKGFPCPLHKDNGDCCTANDDIYGTGDCAGCIAYRAWIHRYYGPTQAGHNPTPNVIMLGYDFDEDPDTFLKELKEYSSQLSKYPAYPSDLIDRFNSILYPPQNDPLNDLAWDLEYTKFKMPSSSFYLTPAPHFQCLGYPIEVCNAHDSSRILTFFAEAYQFLPASLVEDYGLPDMDQTPELQITPSSLITLDIIPWANMVRQSFAFAFQSTATPTMWSTHAIRELVFKVLHNEHDYLVDQFSTQFLEVVEYSSLLTDVFKGAAPFSNEPLKKLAAAGSSYFDSVYYQMTALHKVQTKKSQHLPAPNEPLVELYDMILDRTSPSSELYEHKTSLFSRHWNNKGNSMESLALLMAESGYHSLIIVMSWLVMQLQYRDSSYPWKADYLAP